MPEDKKIEQNDQDNNGADSRQTPTDGGDTQPLKNYTAVKKKKARKTLKPKTVLLTLAVLVVAAALTVAAIQFLAPDPNLEDADNTIYFTQDQDINTVLSWTIYRRDGSIDTFEKNDDGKFFMVDDPEYLLNQSLCKDMAHQGATFHAEGIAEKNAKDLAKYGLDSPQSRLDYTFVDGTQMHYIIGNRTPAQDQYYVMVKDDPTVYLAYDVLGKKLTLTKHSMHEVEISYMNPMYMTYLLVEFSDRPTVELQIRHHTQEHESINYAAMLQPVEYDANTNKMANLFDAIISIKPVDFIGNFDDLSPYGLDEPRVHVIAETRDDPDTYYHANNWELFIGGAADEEHTYMRLDETNDVYTVKNTQLEFLFTDVTVGALVDKLANVIDLRYIDSFTADISGKVMKLDIQREPLYSQDGELALDAAGQQVYDETFLIDGDPATSEADFRRLYQIFISVYVDGIIDKDFDMTAEPVIKIDFDMNAIREHQTLEYLEYDRDNYALRKNGTTLFYVKKERIDMMLAAIDEYKAGVFDEQKYKTLIGE